MPRMRVAIATGVCPRAEVGARVGDGSGVESGPGVVDGDGAGLEVGDGPGMEGDDVPFTFGPLVGVRPGVWVGCGEPVGAISARGVGDTAALTLGVFEPGVRTRPGKLKAASS